ITLINQQFSALVSCFNLCGFDSYQYNSWRERETEGDRDLDMAMGISMPFVGMVMVILAQVTSLILNKEAMASGLNQSVPTQLLIISRLFLLSFIGSSGLLMGLAGLNYASATLNTAMLNLIPAFTFILALLFRMEKLNWRSSSSQAKTIGTKNHIGSLGGLLLAADSFLTSLWFIVQGIVGISFRTNMCTWCLQRTGPVYVSMFKPLAVVFADVIDTWVIRDYPAVLMVTTIRGIFATIQSASIPQITVKGLNAWKLKPDIEFIEAAFEVMLKTGIHLWALNIKGPVYVAMFKPLG
ncbi:nodulin MtN21 /EamA-like transporter family protein, partial [Prunus dulcis]